MKTHTHKWMAPQKRKKMLAEYDAGVAAKELSEKYGVSLNTVYYSVATRDKEVQRQRENENIVETARDYDHGWITKEEALNDITCSRSKFYSVLKRVRNGEL